MAAFATLAGLKMPVAAAYILAAVSACPAQAPARLDFDFTMKDPVFINTVSPEALARLHKKTGGVPAKGRMSGLTQSQFRRKLSLQALQTPLQRGGTGLCLAPVKLVASLELAPTVYISSAYRPGSCKFRATRAHEMQHVRISRGTLEEYAPAVMARLRKAVAALRQEGPLSAAAARRAREKMIGAVGKAYAGVMAEMERDLARRQARIDTEEEYRRVALLCQSGAD